MTDEEAVRELLGSYGSWSKPDDGEYVGKVTALMAELRREHPDGEFPSPVHDANEIGACVDCDALRALDRID